MLTPLVYYIHHTFTLRPIGIIQGALQVWRHRSYIKYLLASCRIKTWRPNLCKIPTQQCQKVHGSGQKTTTKGRRPSLRSNGKSRRKYCEQREETSKITTALHAQTCYAGPHILAKQSHKMRGRRGGGKRPSPQWNVRPCGNDRAKLKRSRRNHGQSPAGVYVRKT